MRKRYLFGPVTGGFASETLRAARDAGECLTFNATGDADVLIAPDDPWEAVQTRWPGGWQPDFIALYLQYAVVPGCLWTAPLPLVALAGDWNLQWHHYRRRLLQCDWILTDALGVERLRSAGIEHARQAVIFGAGRSLLESAWSDGERDIDVLFVGNFNAAVQRERLPWLARLAHLAGQRRVVLATNVYGEAYRRLLARSRIVFNRSIRGECNLRVWEAAAAGALLFQEEGNREVAVFLRDRAECVYYNHDNLEALLRHYLDHEQERRVIAEAARARVHEFRFERFWEVQLQSIHHEWESLSRRMAERRRSDDRDEWLTRTWQALSAGAESDPALIRDLHAAADARPDSAAMQNALGVALGRSNDRGERFSCEQANLAASHFRQACALDPDGVLYRLNLVEALAACGDDRQASAEARQALAILDRQPLLRLEDCDAPHFPPFFDDFRVEWERGGWSHAGKLEEERLHKANLMRWRLHAVLAQLTDDLAHFQAAVKLRPDLPTTQAAFGAALGRAGKPMDAVPPLLQALAINPFDCDAARLLFRALREVHDEEGCRRLIESRRRLHRAAPQLVPQEPWFSQAASSNLEAKGWLRTIGLEDLHRRFGALDTSRALIGFTNALDTHVILALLSSTRPCKRILEIGTAAGHMTANFTEWTDADATAFTLGITADLHASAAPGQRYEDPPREALGRMSNHFGKAHKVFFITADSMTYDFGRLAPLDFVFVDGAHDLPHVVSDSRKAYDVLRPGGMLVWHDFTSPAEWVEVRPALELLHFREPIDHVQGTAVAFLQKGEVPHASHVLRPEKPVAIVWEGAQRVVHSLALVNRSLCSELIGRGHEVSLIPSAQLGFAERGSAGAAPPEGYRASEDEEAALPISLDQRLFHPLSRAADIHVRHQWPPQLKPPQEGRWVIMQPWEFGSPPREWVAVMRDLVDEVWVPSRFVRDGFLAGGIPADRVHVIPNGVDCDRFHPAAKPLPLKTHKRFKFLFVGGTIHRKGIDILLDAYERAFTATDDVCLVIKDMGVGSFYRGQTAEARIAAIRGRPNAPEIEYLTDPLSDADLPGLYTACDCLVHPYRGEGFGLPIAEAMACSLPVIVTNHGAALDFCDPINAYLVPATPAYFPQNRVGDIETIGRPWLAEADRELLIELMRHAVRKPDEGRWKGQHGRQRIERQFTWKHAADAIEARLADLMTRPPRRLAQRPAPVHPDSTRAAVARPTVSLCMIVKNEEDNLAACLGPIAELVDEIIVVDTGSTDRTKEIAAQMGARVFDFPWVDSFAAARNESLRHASGDWIFWMDADDRVDADNRARLAAVFTKLVDENVAHVMKCACVPQEKGGTTTVVDHVRLFRNRPDIRWEYRVHEQILPALRRIGADVCWSDVVILHVGYQDPALRGRKLERDIRLLRLEDADKPEDPFTLFNLGSVYQELGQFSEAIPLLRRSLEKSHPTDSIVRKLYALLSQCHRQIGEKELALAAAAKGREFYPDDVELLFHEGLSRRDLGDAAGAEACWLRSLQPKSAAHFASVDAGLGGYKARHNLAILYQETGRLPDAERQWHRVLAEHPGFIPALLGLGEIMIGQQRWQELEEIVQRVEERAGRLESLLLGARGQLARKHFEEARRMCDEAKAIAPNHLAPRRLLSHALLQEGRDWNAAEQALQKILELVPNDAEARNNLAILQQQRKATQ